MPVYIRPEEIDLSNKYQAINVETNKGVCYRIIIDVVDDGSLDELRVYKDNDSEPPLRLEL